MCFGSRFSRLSFFWRSSLRRAPGLRARRVSFWWPGARQRSRSNFPVSLFHEQRQARVTFRMADVHGKSIVNRKHTSPGARCGGARKKSTPSSQLACVPHRGGSCFWQHRTSICCLEPYGPSQMIEFVSAASPENNSKGASGLDRDTPTIDSSTPKKPVFGAGYAAAQNRKQCRETKRRPLPFRA